MKNDATTLETLVSNAEEYGKTSLELIKLKTVDKAADIVSSLLSRLALVTVVALFILIVNIGLAIWIGDLMGKMYYGFFVIAGFYALIALILHIGRHSIIKNPIRNYFINQVLHK